MKLPTPGIPRLADGKPNLAAPAPRTADGKPDLSGLWQNAVGDRIYNDITVDLPPGEVAPLRPTPSIGNGGWSSARTAWRRYASRWARRYSPRATAEPYGPDADAGDVSVQGRDAPRIWMDGRLVVGPESDVDGILRRPLGRRHAGRREQRLHRRSWLDFDGHPHTEQLRITERYSRPRSAASTSQVTMVDPKAY